jgi:hypothetical protein
MKLIKNASGKIALKLSKSDWVKVGKRAGWIKTSLFSDTNAIDDYTREIVRTVNRYLADRLPMEALHEAAESFGMSFGELQNILYKVDSGAMDALRRRAHDADYYDDEADLQEETEEETEEGGEEEDFDLGRFMKANM